MPKPSLADLLERIARRDMDAFHALYNAVGGKLFAVALRILKQNDMAEDVLQDSFLKIWDGAEGYHSGKGAPMSWMTAIVRNRAIDQLRKRSTSEVSATQVIEEVTYDHAPDPLALTEQSADLRALARCLEVLDASHRDCLLMAYYHGFTHEEIAQRMAAPVGTIKSRIRRGLARIRSCLSHD